MERTFEHGQRVLLYNSRLKLFPGKLKSRWSRPFVITKVTPYRAIDVKDEKTNNTFLANGQRVERCNATRFNAIGKCRELWKAKWSKFGMLEVIMESVEEGSKQKLDAAATLCGAATTFVSKKKKEIKKRSKHYMVLQQHL
ncbi:uncharacterized protein G2W53_032982 [Senna tora]|uniref:Uncharacterized protein n=1 Tax=Senna tora TaxID=362788 RepID=A0A834SYD3_9FABA|nr:uncharacterized protein G2W53_032982 [Senna tora]